MSFNIIRYFVGVKQRTRSIIASISTAISFYYAAFLSTSIAEVAGKNENYGIAIHATVFMVLLFVIIFISKLIQEKIENIQKEIEFEKITISRAHTYCDRNLSEWTRAIENNDVAEKEHFIATQIGLKGNYIKGLVDATYHTFESSYGKSSSSEERIDFEVTFMTKSLKDEFITIPASNNKDGRQPRSMLMRPDNPGIYENTATATVYKMKNPSMYIIEDTTSSGTHYEEIYSGQRERIKSSLIYPVLSHKNRLLGTLVVHCDRACFFKNSGKKYWSDLLEIFSKKVAHEMIKIETVHSLAKDANKLSINYDYDPPF
jgi:hypothetical protein